MSPCENTPDPGDPRIVAAARLLAEEQVSRPIVVNLRATFGLTATEVVAAIRAANRLRQEVRS